MKPVCEPDQGAAGGDGLCAAATRTCTAAGAGFTRYNVWRSTDQGRTYQAVPPSVCLGPADVVDVAQVVADAQTAIRRLNLGQPQVLTNPPVSTFVNIPTIFHATVQGPRTLTLTLDGVTVALTVAPRWTWDFGDGSTLDADSPGIGYDDTSLTTDPDHYPVLHTYAEHGAFRVGLTVIWTGTFTLTGVAGTFPAPVKTYTAGRALPVRQATATITGNG